MEDVGAPLSDPAAVAEVLKEINKSVCTLVKKNLYGPKLAVHLNASPSALELSDGDRSQASRLFKHSKLNCKIPIHG